MPFLKHEIHGVEGEGGDRKVKEGGRDGTQTHLIDHFCQ